MLVHHRDPESLRRHRRQPDDGFTFEDDRAGIRLRCAGRDVHQRRLASAVLAEKRVHLAGHDVERDIVERGDAVEVLADAAHGERRHFDGLRLRGRSSDCG